MDQITPKTTKEFKIVGSRPLRPDGIDKVTGKAMYGADLYAPNMLYGCLLRINELVMNNNLNDDLLSQISIICSSSCDPIDDKRGTIEFRSHVAGVLAKRAIIQAHSRAGDKIEKIAR